LLASAITYIENYQKFQFSEFTYPEASSKGVPAIEEALKREHPAS
jgi:hypothetical protein